VWMDVPRSTATAGVAVTFLKAFWFRTVQEAHKSTKAPPLRVIAGLNGVPQTLAGARRASAAPTFLP
jgi:hypothetical protein